MFKPHIAEVLWGAVVTVSLSKDWESPPFCDGDGQKIFALIKEIEQSYFAGKESDSRSDSDLQSPKNRVLSKYGYKGEKREFISRVISTYFSWMYHGTPTWRKAKLDVVLSLPPAPHSIFKGVPNATSVQS